MSLSRREVARLLAVMDGFAPEEAQLLADHIELLMERIRELEAQVGRHGEEQS